MAYISLSGKRETDLAVSENKRVLSDADYDRVAYWGAKTYFPNGVMQESGIPRAPTGEEVFNAITDAIYAEIKTKVDALHWQEAAAAAVAAVTPIELTQG